MNCFIYFLFPNNKISILKSAEYVPNLLKNHSTVQLAGSWKSEIGVLDQYGNFELFSYLKLIVILEIF